MFRGGRLWPRPSGLRGPPLSLGTEEGPPLQAHPELPPLGNLEGEHVGSADEEPVEVTAEADDAGFRNEYMAALLRNRDVSRAEAGR